jgi:hypothetical protein
VDAEAISCNYDYNKDKCNITGCGVGKILKKCHNECCENTNTSNKKFWLISNYEGVLRYFNDEYNDTLYDDRQNKLQQLVNSIKKCFKENPFDCNLENPYFIMGKKYNGNGIVFSSNSYRSENITRFN